MNEFPASNTFHIDKKLLSFGLSPVIFMSDKSHSLLPPVQLGPTIRRTQSTHLQTIQSDSREYLYPITIILIFSSLRSNIIYRIYSHMHRFLLPLYVLTITTFRYPPPSLLDRSFLKMNNSIIMN